MAAARKAFSHLADKLHLGHSRSTSNHEASANTSANSSKSHLPQHASLVKTIVPPIWPPEDWLRHTPTSEHESEISYTPPLSITRGSNSTASTSEPIDEFDHDVYDEHKLFAEEPEELDTAGGAISISPKDDGYEDSVVRSPSEATTKTSSSQSPTPSPKRSSPTPSARSARSSTVGPRSSTDAISTSPDTPNVLSSEPRELDQPGDVDLNASTSSRPTLPRLLLPEDDHPQTETPLTTNLTSPEFCTSPDGMGPSPMTPIAAMPFQLDDPNTPATAKPAVTPERLPTPTPPLTNAFPFPRPPVHPTRQPSPAPPPKDDRPRLPKPPRHPAVPANRTPAQVKETLGARTSLTPDGSRMINQYILLDRIGRGSFGIVQVCLDAESGTYYAIKELNRVRLRKRAEREAARKARQRLVNKRSLGQVDEDREDKRPLVATKEDALYLVRNEIAIMKKVNHPNVVKLYEVLDESSEDMLYLVLELCRGGPIMNISLDPSELRGGPLPRETAWDFFRQVVLGVEYLHENEIIHHDIKPDNILLTADRKTCKIVDFGVSAVFEKPGDDICGNTVASPAFASPEQVTSARQSNDTLGVHGTASDIWAMGVTLFCMVTGHLPWEHTEILEMYEAIEHSPLPEFSKDWGDDLSDLITRLLDKNPETRIKMPAIRTHPWITKGNTVILPASSRHATPVTPVTQHDIDHAIFTGWSSVKDAFIDSVAAAREASKAHARSRGGSDRVGEGTRRAFWKAFRKEMETRSLGSIQTGWTEFRHRTSASTMSSGRSRQSAASSLSSGSGVTGRPS